MRILDLYIPPVEITQGNISTTVDELDYVSVSTFSPKRKICHGSVPSSVTIVQHLTNLVYSFLICQALIFENKDNVNILALNKVFSV